MDDELQALNDKLADILNRTVNALRGEPPPLTQWSWHDLPELAAAARASAARPPMNEMVDRFLQWRLPDTFAPDCGITFTKLNHPNSWPVGTNLLTAHEARAMLEHVLGATPPPEGA
jgi:hypothetical protein